MRPLRELGTGAVSGFGAVHEALLAVLAPRDPARQATAWSIDPVHGPERCAACSCSQARQKAVAWAASSQKAPTRGWLADGAHPDGASGRHSGTTQRCGDTCDDYVAREHLTWQAAVGSVGRRQPDYLSPVQGTGRVIPNRPDPGSSRPALASATEHFLRARVLFKVGSLHYVLERDLYRIEFPSDSLID